MHAQLRCDRIVASLLGATLVCAGVLVLAASPARAAERFWISADDGNFDDPVNWDDGVPGPGDVAVHDVAATYRVLINGAFSADRAVLRRGLVTFDLAPGSTYTLTGPGVTAPGVTVGAGGGDLADLVVRGGTVTGVFASLGAEPGGIGAIRMDGTSARLAISERLAVGRAGVGFLDVIGSGEVTCGEAGLGDAAGAWGSAALDGAGSSLAVDDRLTIGGGGAGDLTIGTGADVSCGEAIIALGDNASGSVIVSGSASRWTMDGTLDVGMSGSGALVIEDGGSVTNGVFASIGTYPAGSFGGPAGDGGRGEVTVRDPGSRWSVEGDLYVGFRADGRLLVAEGGAVVIAGNLLINRWDESTPEAPVVFGLGEGWDLGVSPAISVAGRVDSDTGVPTVRLELVPGFEPVPGDVFPLITSPAGLESVDVLTPPLEPPSQWVITRSGATLVAHVAECEFFTDCNGNGVGDDCDLAFGLAEDVNGNGVPDECECLGDLDRSGDVGFNDLLALLMVWGDCSGCPEDLDEDGVVGLEELLILLGGWGPCPS